MLRFVHALVFALVASLGIASGAHALGPETALREIFDLAHGRVGTFAAEAVGRRQQNRAFATTITSDSPHAARGAPRLFPGGVDDVIASAARPSRTGSTTSRAVQALQKKVSNPGKAANFGGLKADEATANSIIREAFGAQNPVFRTSTNRAGQGVIDVLNPSTGRGVRLLEESGASDTFVNF